MPLNSHSSLLNNGSNIDTLTIVTNKVHCCFDKADAFFGNTFNRPTCNLKQRGRAAGTAHLQKNEVRFNVFMYSQNPEEFISTVVPHEAAHIIVFQIYGSSAKPHGKEWQAVMLKVFGIKPNRTHCFDVPPPKQVFEYFCDCNRHEFTKRRHTKVQQGVLYICKACKASLQFKG
ncbi:SprT family zinc-dependent metalloprotease [Marinomonas colpomeniae]|uniref:SprT family zinc-dependent metalloprotease n=1 Tax=Marinomonas colpomeniae TaxID=2774408 RepID=A0ABR8P183_9GAMM|nr:SprT family zinc-dependent metalloprotease [Marinomonas colpomeniae]MBD5772039.1 SprT family zinc-dependent metalloprotease [Marinomonas colpomeniae]